MIYDKLLRLPLFTGMSLDELQRIMSKTKIDFGKYEEGSAIVRKGEKCSRLLIVVDGTVESFAESDDGSFSLSELLHAPVILQQNAIFGRFQEFTRTVKAVSKVSTITLDKTEIQSLISKSMVFRLNLLGTFSTVLQKREQELWRQSATSLEDRIIFFFRLHCLTPVGQKFFKIKMQTLAGILNSKRRDVSQALNSLQDQHLLVLSRGKVEIPDMHRLLETGVMPL